MLIPLPDRFQQNRFESESGTVFQSGFKDPSDSGKIRSRIADLAELLDRIRGFHVIQSIGTLFQERDQKERDFMEPGGEDLACELRIAGVAEVVVQQTDPFRGGRVNVRGVAAFPGFEALIVLFSRSSRVTGVVTCFCVFSRTRVGSHSGK